MWHIFSYVFVFVFKHILSILSWWGRKPKHVRIIVLWYCYFYSNYIILTFVVASCRGGEISMFFMWFLRFVCIVCVIIFWINVRERSLNLSFVCFICSSAKKGFKNKNGQYITSTNPCPNQKHFYRNLRRISVCGQKYFNR